MSEYISINAQTIRRNAKNGTDDPPIRIARIFHDRNPRYAHAVKIHAPSELIYNSQKPILGCGARLVLKVPSGMVEVLK